MPNTGGKPGDCYPQHWDHCWHCHHPHQSGSDAPKTGGTPPVLKPGSKVRYVLQQEARINSGFGKDVVTIGTYDDRVRAETIAKELKFDKLATRILTVPVK